MKYLTIFLFIFFQLTTMAQNDITDGQCDKVMTYGGPPGHTQTLIFNIPPGQQPGPKLFEYLAVNNFAPDGVSVYADNKLLGSAWVGGSSLCRYGASGLDDPNCVLGPIAWTNENNPGGTGSFVNITNYIAWKDIWPFFTNNGLPHYLSRAEELVITGNLYMRIVVPHDTCQLKFVIQSSTTSGTFWASKLKCPKITCPDASTMEKLANDSVEVTCNKIKVKGSCPMVAENSKWNFNGTTLTGNEVEFNRPAIGGNSEITLTTPYANNCTFEKKIPITLVDLLNIQGASQDSSCQEVADGKISAKVSGGDAPYDIKWQHNNLKDLELTGLKAGSYTVKVTDQKNCMVEKTIDVLAGKPIEINLTTEDVLCYGDSSGKINSSTTNTHGTVNYNWSNGTKTQNVDKLNVGKYQVTVTDEKGCSASKAAEIKQPKQKLTLDFKSYGTACENTASGKIELNLSGGTAPYKTEFQGQTFSGANEVFKELFEGDYDIAVIDDHGCSEKIKVNISNDPAKLEAQVISDGCDIGAKLSLSNFLNGVIYEEHRSSLKIDKDDPFQFTLSLDYQGCHFETTAPLQGPLPSSAMRINFPNVFSPNDDGVNDTFTVFPQYPLLVNSFSIYDRWGNRLFHDENPGIIDSNYRGWDGTAGGEKMMPGVYVYKLELPCGKVIAGDITLVR